MAPRGDILIYDNDNGNSASEQGSNDTDMVDSKKYLSFIIARDKAKMSPSLKDEGCAESSQADPRPRISPQVQGQKRQ